MAARKGFQSPIGPEFPPQTKRTRPGPGLTGASLSESSQVPEPADPGGYGRGRVPGRHQEADAALHRKSPDADGSRIRRQANALAAPLQFGPNGYYFAMDPNGYVLLHPNLQPMVRPGEPIYGADVPE